MIAIHPTTGHPTTGNAATPRVGSVDLVRGVTILAMLFVNDVAGVRGVPPWMKHIEPSTADGLTFVDVVFPAFLFIVGLSLPVAALERRMAEVGRGWRLWRHILAHTLGLLIIGVLMVNTESLAESGPISPQSLDVSHVPGSNSRLAAAPLPGKGWPPHALA